MEALKVEWKEGVRGEIARISGVNYRGSFHGIVTLQISQITDSYFILRAENWATEKKLFTKDFRSSEDAKKYAEAWIERRLA